MCLCAKLGQWDNGTRYVFTGAGSHMHGQGEAVAEFRPWALK